MKKHVAPAFVVMLVLLQLAAIMFRIDSWPLTYYPMFATPDSFPLKGYEFRIQNAEGEEFRIEEFSKVALEVYDFALLNSRQDIIEKFVHEQILYLKANGAIPSNAVSLKLMQTQMDPRTSPARNDVAIYSTRIAP